MESVCFGYRALRGSPSGLVIARRASCHLELIAPHSEATLLNQRLAVSSVAFHLSSQGSHWVGKLGKGWGKANIFHCRELGQGLMDRAPGSELVGNFLSPLARLGSVVSRVGVLSRVPPLSRPYPPFFLLTPHLYISWCLVSHFVRLITG